MSVWDNQQATSWFAGILEGEGSACKDKDKRVVIEVSNTDTDIIDACVNFLAANGVLHARYERKYKNRRKWKTLHLVRVVDANNCHSLLKTLGNTFQCRRQEFITKLELGASTTIRDTTLSADLYWLIGFFEAEGSISLSLTHKGNFVPDISVKNTRKVLLEKLALTLHTLQCSWYVSSYNTDVPQHSEVFSVMIKGMLRSKRFLMIVKDLFRSRRYAKRANLLLEFINSRLRRAHKEPYSEAERLIHRQLKSMI